MYENRPWLTITPSMESIPNPVKLFADPPNFCRWCHKASEVVRNKGDMVLHQSFTLYCSCDCRRKYRSKKARMNPSPSRVRREEQAKINRQNKIELKVQRKEEYKKQQALNKANRVRKSEENRNIKALNRINRLMLRMIFQPHICKRCGTYFESVYYSQLYCRSCRTFRANETGNTKDRCIKYGLPYDPTITLNKIRKRDNNICQICYKAIETNPKGIGRPTIDHIIPLAAVGSLGHVEINVQLAHLGCNSRKHVKDANGIPYRLAVIK